MSTSLKLLCAGAAQGVVNALQQRFADESGARIEGRFGAVGAMREALLAGEACDVMIVTDAMVSALVAAGELRGDTRAALGRVRTGVAARAEDPRPDIGSVDALRSSLLAASALYFPDPQRATAGIHFDAVLRKLGIHAAVAARCLSFPNGATAMRELAASAPAALGCTQITEIKSTGGVSLLGPLPDELELSTVYTAAVAVRSAQPELARRFIALVAGPQSHSLRAAGGFEFDGIGGDGVPEQRRVYRPQPPYP